MAQSSIMIHPYHAAKFVHTHSILCGLCRLEPKLEVADTGCMIFCQKCCSNDTVVLMRWETCCCGLVRNRVSYCDNCCGLYG